MTFGYECRPSFWRTVRTNSHLVIAALGTVSFLGVAAFGLWLAMPSDDRPSLAEAGQDKAGYQDDGEAGTAGAVAASPASVPTASPEEAATPPIATADAQEEAPKPADARWKDPAAAAKSPTTAKDALDAANPVADAPAADAATSPLAAFAAENRAQVGGDQDNAGANPDAAETAAIPAAKPKPAAKAASAGGGGQILRPVTMRSGPAKGAAAIATVPARTAVEVLSCDKWCEIVYDGKRGWIYKSFLDRE